MHFETYVPERDRRKLDEPIEQIRPVILRYVVRGRNTWHATWTNHYFDGCLHDTVQSAKRYAESKRGSGSVFYIKEIPALAYIGSQYCGVVTQINAHLPLAHYRVRSLEKKTTAFWIESRLVQLTPGEETFSLSESGGLLTCKKRVALAIRGQMISAALASFAPDAPFWSERPPTKNSVLRVWQQRGTFELDRLAEGPLNTFRSYAKGSAYYLGWSSTVATTSPSHIITLARRLGRTRKLVLE